VPEPTAPEALLILRDIKKHYPITRGLLRKEVGTIKAVDGIDLSIARGETLGLVGESGCGKSTLGRLIMRLEDPTGGEMLFGGKDMLKLSPAETKAYRRRVQIIFQDPYASLNPRQTIGRIIGEGLTIHRIGTPQEKRDRIRYLMDVVGLHPDQISRYPHEFSGGQRQRIGIARALALQPEMMICDEPLSALDVSIQAQIINLLQDLQAEYHLTYLFISHDLSVVRHISNRVAVMYLGSIVELADKKELFENPLHPYTQALLRAVPTPDPEAVRIRDQIPEESAATTGDGCSFQERCPSSMQICETVKPPLIEYRPRHWVRCHLQD
jgi:peptide/nickel transport system ATP-binding protein/oligopeptide transport system ATP-binding protein